MSEITQYLRVLTRVARVKRLTPITVLLGAVVVFGVGVAGAAPLGSVTEFSSGLNLAATLSNVIAESPDGNIWFADKGSTADDHSAIGMINPSTAISEFSIAASGGNAAACPATRLRRARTATSGSPTRARLRRSG